MEIICKPCAGESEKVVLWNLIIKYYFPEVVNLVKECMECSLWDV